MNEKIKETPPKNSFIDDLPERLPIQPGVRQNPLHIKTALRGCFLFGNTFGYLIT